jgi:hypothetical protein
MQEHHPRFRKKTEVDAVSITNDSRSQVVNSPPPIQRQSSLRTKLSLPNLRRKQSRNNTNEDLISSSVSMMGSQISHAPQDAGEMLQVKDMEFELVRPNFAHFQGAAARTSEDSGVLGCESARRARSSGGHSPDMWPQPPVPCRPTTDSESSIEAPSKSRTQVDVAHVVLACVAIAQVQKSQEGSPGRWRSSTCSNLALQPRSVPFPSGHPTLCNKVCRILFVSLSYFLMTPSQDL